MRRKRQPTRVFLAGKFHEQKSLTGYNPWSCKEWTRLSNWAQIHLYKYIYNIVNLPAYISLADYGLDCSKWVTNSRIHVFVKYLPPLTLCLANKAFANIMKTKFDKCLHTGDIPFAMPFFGLSLPCHEGS